MPAAQIGAPWGFAFDTEGNLYISDDIPGDDYGPDATRIRKVSPDGIITTVAGIGKLGYAGDGGPALAAEIDSAGPLTVDNAGNIYFAGESRIRKISPDGIISTIAGSLRVGYSGDGGLAVNGPRRSDRGLGWQLPAHADTDCPVCGQDDTAIVTDEADVHLLEQDAAARIAELKDMLNRHNRKLAARGEKMTFEMTGDLKRTKIGMI